MSSCDWRTDERLEALAKEYGEPVLPLSAVCNAVATWARCIDDNNTPPLLRANRREQGAGYHYMLHHILIDIRKSNLLGRLLYAKQALRTKPCPKHEGHMDMEELLTGREGCPCQGTGWLPEALGMKRYTGNVFLGAMDQTPDGTVVFKNITPKT